jgi:dihydropteroate synthase
MHMRHTPPDMTRLAHYDDVAAEVTAELSARIETALAGGIARHNIAIDPGIGFAKTPAHNLELLPRLAMLATLGCRILVGVSRKGFIGKLSDVATPHARTAGSIAAGLHALAHGASILRVHDVAETVQAIRVWRGIAGTV